MEQPANKQTCKTTPLACTKFMNQLPAPQTPPAIWRIGRPPHHFSVALRWKTTDDASGHHVASATDTTTILLSGIIKDDDGLYTTQRKTLWGILETFLGGQSISCVHKGCKISCSSTFCAFAHYLDLFYLV
jgi:hypothetical protein